MLLRRITEHVKTQNWTAVALDFVIVVVGVFIGIQVSNWNDARVERSAEARYLTSLDQDMKDSIIEIDGVVEQLLKHEDARRTLFNYSLNPDDGIEPEELPLVISAALWQFHSAELRVTTFDTLRNSGGLGVFGDDDLVVALLDLAALIEESEFANQLELHILERFTDQILYDEVDMAAVMTARGLETGEVHVPWVNVDTETFVAPAFFKTQQFRNSLLFRSASTNDRVRTFRNIRNQCTEIRRLINNRQKALGRAP